VYLRKRALSFCRSCGALGKRGHEFCVLGIRFAVEGKSCVSPQKSPIFLRLLWCSRKRRGCVLSIRNKVCCGGKELFISAEELYRSAGLVGFY